MTNTIVAHIPRETTPGTIISEREETHGSFKDNARTTTAIKIALLAGVNNHRLTDAQREALDVIALKMSRIVNGNPAYKDHWHDIAGYAALALESSDG